MWGLVRYMLLLILFWIALFLVQQCCFVFFAPVHLAGLDHGLIRMGFLRAVPMHVSTACYMVLPCALITSILLHRNSRFARRLLRTMTATLVVITCFINVCDIALFNAWGTKVNHKALSYLAYPEESLHAAAGAPLGQLTVILLAQCACALLILRRIDPLMVRPGPSTLQRWLPALLLPIPLFIGMRGGVQPFPIDRSWSYYSAHPILNLGALNGTWNVIVLLAEPPEIQSNPYKAMPVEAAESRYAALHPPGSTTGPALFSLQRPNILLILLESWTADVVGVLGGDSGVTPGLDRWSKEGLLFTNFYSTGFRTEQGLCALISAFPSQPKTTIIRQYGKFDRLPSLVNRLDSAGYSSTYYYAGDVSFANTRSYLEAMGFDRVHDESSFPIVKRTDWGAYDEELFAFYRREVVHAQRPFFHLVMTSTSHEPFDVPLDEGFPGTAQPQQYRNSVHYTDRVLADLLDSCRSASWYDSTVVIIVADHGHFLPHNRASYAAERHRIPLLIIGGALLPEWRGARNSTYGSHVDIGNTLLRQLGLAPMRSRWGKDLLDPRVPHFAFWTFDDGFGLADAQQMLVWDNIAGRVLQQRDTTTSSAADSLHLLQGRALQQVLLDQYLGLSQ